MQLNPYLNFNGQCETAFKFYEQTLGAKIECLLQHEGTPAEKHSPADWKHKVLHGRISLNGQVIMASDCPPEHYQKPQGFFVTLSIKEPAEAERVFQALSENGAVNMPIQETFWAVRFGMLTDQFGIPWMVNCEKTAPFTAEDVANCQAVAV